MRPTVTSGLAAALAVAALAFPPASAQGKACTPIPPQKLGFQLYSLRSLLVTADGAPTPPERLQAVLERARKIGFRQTERFGGTLGEPIGTYQAAARQAGVAAVASHDSLDMAGWESTLDQARAFGQTYVGSGQFGPPGFATLESTLQTAANLNRLGKAAADRGLKFYVHNHAGEFRQTFPYDLHKTGKLQPTPVWEIVAANTDPRYVRFEIDVHWARVGIGVDRFGELLDFLRRHRDRIELLHVKDTLANGQMTDLGAGTTDWPSVFEAAGPQIRYYFWEYDDPPDPFASAETGYRYLTCQAGPGLREAKPARR